MAKLPVARKLAVGQQPVFWLLVVFKFWLFQNTCMVYKHAFLLHSAFMLSVVKLLLKGEVGVCTLNSHGNCIVDHWKSWKNHENMFLNFYGNPAKCLGPTVCKGHQQMTLGDKELMERICTNWSKFFPINSALIWKEISVPVCSIGRN